MEPRDVWGWPRAADFVAAQVGSFLGYTGCEPTWPRRASGLRGCWGAAGPANDIGPAVGSLTSGSCRATPCLNLRQARVN